jgi:hypothetical protein
VPPASALRAYTVRVAVPVSVRAAASAVERHVAYRQAPVSPTRPMLPRIARPIRPPQPVS